MVYGRLSLTLSNNKSETLYVGMEAPSSSDNLVSIDDVTIKSVLQSEWDASRDADVTFDSEHAFYEPNSKTIYGRANLWLGTANSTKTRLRRLIITMPALGGGGGTYTITDGNVTADSSDPYDPSDNPNVLNVLSTFKVDGISKSFTSLVNVADVYQAGIEAGGGGGGASY
jgi:hypothetical protein